MSTFLTDIKSTYSGKKQLKKSNASDYKSFVLDQKEINEDMTMDEIADVTSDRMMKVFIKEKAKKRTVEEKIIVE